MWIEFGSMSAFTAVCDPFGEIYRIHFTFLGQEVMEVVQMGTQEKIKTLQRF